MLRVQALSYLATPFISVSEVMMRRSLDFRRLAIVSLVASAVAAVVALVGALSGWGVWTLVWAPIALFWVRALGYIIATRFLPIPSFNFKGTGGMLAFGAAMLGSQLLWLIAMALFIISSLLGGLNYISTILNMRTKGMSMTRMPLPIWAMFFTAVLGVLSFPVLLSGAILLLFDRNLGTSF